MFELRTTVYLHRYYKTFSQSNECKLQRNGATATIAKYVLTDYNNYYYQKHLGQIFVQLVYLSSCSKI